MIDPFSVTAAIGFGLAVISFLSNTVSTLVRQGHEFQQCEDCLKAYSAQLQTIQLEMLNWQMIWYGTHGFSEEAYIYCWGPKGYEGIKSRFQLISKLMASIKTQLSYPTTGARNEKKLSQRHQVVWEDLTRQLELQPGHAPPRRDVLGKIAFAISKNSQLKEDIARLRRLTEDLITCCHKTLRQRQGTDIKKEPTREEVARINNTMIFSQDLTKFANDLFCAQESYEWDLGLRVPDPDGDATQTDNSASISMDFLVQGQCRCEQWTAGRFCIQYHTRHSFKSNGEPLSIRQEIRDELASCTGTTRSQNRRQQFVIQEEPKYSGRSVRNLLTAKKWYVVNRGTCDEERMMIALGLVNWVCLLWYTTWTSIPCLCKICPIVLENRRRQWVLKPSFSSHTEPPCLITDISNDKHKLLLLGRILAELAFAKPLGIKAQGENFFFIKDGEPMTKEEILQDLRRLGYVRNLGIYKAIHYCFHTEDKGVHERADRVCEHAENIVQP